MVQIARTSLLNFADLIETGGLQFFDTPDFPMFDPDVTDNVVTIGPEHQHRLDLLAYDAYDDVNLWWVIAYVNQIRVVPNDVKVGLQVRLPTLSRVQEFLGRAR